MKIENKLAYMFRMTKWRFNNMLTALTENHKINVAIDSNYYMKT